MPFADPMTWVARESRWVKRISKPVKQSFYFAPKKHGVEATENGSRSAMRSWWSAQQAIIDSTANEVQKELARQFLFRVVSRLDYGKFMGEPAGMPTMDTDIARCLVIEELEGTLHGPAVNAACDTVLGSGKYDELRSLADTVAGKLITTVDKSRLVSHHIDRWLQMQESLVGAGKLKEKSFRIYRGQMNKLREIVGNGTLDCLETQWVQDQYHLIATSALASTTRAGQWDVWQAFFNYLDANGVWSKPHIMTKLSFPRRADRRKENWTALEYQLALASREPPLNRLVLLLAANCSFYAADMVKCMKYYNLSKGTICMSRAKTERHTFAERVYVLWPETILALNSFGSELPGSYASILRMKWSKPLKQLRHTTKSFILNSDSYPHYVKAMTGEVGQSDDEKYYWTMGKLIPAFAYLRKCYGFGD